MEVLVAAILAVTTWLGISVYTSKKRREALLLKYRDPAIVEMIMRRMFWQGQTQEQLIDSMGGPVDVDERVLKTKTKETWKYNRVGKNRFALRIILENGVVVGWDQK